MAVIDVDYSRLLEDINNFGYEYEDVSRGCLRKQIPNYNISYRFTDNLFPALTLKKLAFKQVVTELIWFLSGDTDIQYLKDNNCNIWNKDAANYDEKGLNVGKAYGYQWRNFGSESGNDQITNLILGMMDNIMRTDLIVSAWNPNQLKETALPPCHNFFQICGKPLGNGSYGFYLNFNMRSCDVFLGLPFNIASYALLAKILENITGHKALGINATLNNVHLYDNSYNAVNEILANRKIHQYGAPELVIPKEFNLQNIKNTNLDDFKLLNYKSYAPIKVEMLAKL